MIDTWQIQENLNYARAGLHKAVGGYVSAQQNGGDIEAALFNLRLSRKIVLLLEAELANAS